MSDAPPIQPGVDVPQVLEHINRLLHHDPAQALPMAEAMALHARQLGDPALLARALADHALALALQGQPDAAVVLARRALETAERCHDAKLKHLALTRVAFALLLQGCAEASLDYLMQAVQGLHEGSDPIDVGRLKHRVGQTLMALDRLADAEHWMVHALNDLGHSVHAAATWADRAALLAQQGRWQEALHCLDEGEKLTDRHADALRRASMLHNRIAWYARQDRLDEAQTLLQQHRALLERFPYVLTDARLDLAEGHARANDLTALNQELDALRTVEHSVPDRIRLLKLESKAALLRGLHQAAESCLNEAHRLETGVRAKQDQAKVDALQASLQHLETRIQLALVKEEVQRLRAEIASKESVLASLGAHRATVPSVLAELRALHPHADADLTALGFRLVYQPVLNIRHWRLVGAEALLRLTHPLEGELLPFDFLARLEMHQHDMREVGQWVLAQACLELQRWRRLGWDDMLMSVNASLHQLEAANFAPAVQAELSRLMLPGAELELEITESLAMHDSQALRHSLSELGRLGVRHAIDDFGTGYSNYSRLCETTPHKIKLDRSLTTRLSRGAHDQAVIETLIQSAHQLRMSVTAEGVETAEQLAWLSQHGCDTAQGFLIGKALPAAELAALHDRSPQAWQQLLMGAQRRQQA